MIKLDEQIIEPFNEAFGHDLDTANMNATHVSDTKQDVPTKPDGIVVKQTQSSNLIDSNTKSEGEIQTTSNLLSSVETFSSQEISENMETIIARDVEQGRCAAFKKIGIVNEKRSVNEPKLIPVSI